MMSSSKNRVHILIFPYPAQGHMLPLLDFTHQLSLKGVKITILVTPMNLPILNPILESNPSIQTLVLPFPNSPLIPQGVENVRDLGNHGNLPMMSALMELKEPIVNWFESHCDPPVAIVSDFFLGWTHQLACELKIRRVTFYASGVFFTAVSEHLWGNSEVVKIESEVKFEDLPGGPGFTWEQVPSLYRRCRELELGSGPIFELIKSSMVANRLSWASVFNSFEDLESEFVEYMREKMGRKRVYCVGPLHLSGGPGGPVEKLEPDGGVFSWLDECDDDSVLYVCFGSQKLLKKAQVEALADGLERSGVKFVWVVKNLTDQQVADGYCGSVPDGFEDRVEGRGWVMKGWAPQASILNHRAVGGFLSHCGWNSVLEGVAAGVVILGWPMEADQFVDARLIVEYRGVSVQVCEGGDTVPDSDELARKIAESMRGDVVEKFRAKELSRKALKAVEVGGSSSKDLDGLVQELALLKKG